MIRNESADFQKIKYGTLSRVYGISHPHLGLHIWCEYSIIKKIKYLDYIWNSIKRVN